MVDQERPPPRDRGRGRAGIGWRRSSGDGEYGGACGAAMESILEAEGVEIEGSRAAMEVAASIGIV